jgi:hypothetical protein
MHHAGKVRIESSDLDLTGRIQARPRCAIVVAAPHLIVQIAVAGFV